MNPTNQLLATLKSLFFGASSETVPAPEVIAAPIVANLANTQPGYHRRYVPGDGNCGYAATDLDGKQGDAAREAAHTLLKNNLQYPIVCELLKPALREMLTFAATPVTPTESKRKFKGQGSDLKEQKHEEDLKERTNAAIFLRYLKEESSIPFAISGDKKQFDNILSHLEYLVTLPKVIQDFIDFDMIVNHAYAHPYVLRALAFIKGIELNIWTITNTTGELVPHTSGIHLGADYCPNTKNVSAERQDIVYVNGNHFDKLELVGYPAQVPNKGIQQVLTLSDYLHAFHMQLTAYKKDLELELACASFFRRRKQKRLTDVQRLLTDITECQQALASDLSDPSILWIKERLSALITRINDIDKGISREHSLTTSRLHTCLANTTNLKTAIHERFSEYESKSKSSAAITSNTTEQKKLILNQCLARLKTDLQTYQDAYRLTSWTSRFVTSQREQNTTALLTTIAKISSDLNNRGTMTLTQLNNLVQKLNALNAQIQKIHEEITTEYSVNSRLLKALTPYTIQYSHLKEPMTYWALQTAQSLASEIVAKYDKTDVTIIVKSFCCLPLNSAKTNAINENSTALATRIEQAKSEQILKASISAIEVYVKNSNHLVTTATLAKILAAIERVETENQTAKQMLTVIIEQIVAMADKEFRLIETEHSFSSLDSGSTDQETKASDSTTLSSDIDAVKGVAMADEVHIEADSASRLLTFLFNQFTALTSTLPLALVTGNSVEAVKSVITSVITDLTPSSAVSINPPNGSHPSAQSFSQINLCSDTQRVGIPSPNLAVDSRY